MVEKNSPKANNYFAVEIQIIKNGEHEIIEKHGVKGKESTPEHGYNKLKDNIKAMRKKNYPNDSFAMTIIKYYPITKEQYDLLAPTNV